MTPLTENYESQIARLRYTVCRIEVNLYDLITTPDTMETTSATSNNINVWKTGLLVLYSTVCAIMAKYITGLTRNAVTFAPGSKVPYVLGTKVGQF